jgi:hypothetical protein
MKACVMATEECPLLECCTVLVFGGTTHKISDVCQDHRQRLRDVYFKYVIFVCVCFFKFRGVK